MDINQAVAAAREVNKKIQSYKKEDKIGLHPLYEQAVKLAKHISYHSTYDIFPEELFANRSPNQTEAEAKYIKDNYRQYTLPFFVDYQSTTCRIFADNNWHIDYREDDSDETFKDYVERQLPIYGSVENYMKFVDSANDTIDANGFIAIRPKELPVKEVNGESIIDSTTLNKPTIFFYPSKDVITYKEDEYYLFLSPEKSYVEYAGRKVNEGSVYEFYAKDKIYKIIQKGKKIDNEFDTIEFFEYKELPVIQIKGIPKVEGERVLWLSPFVYSADLLDDVLVLENWLKASVNTCMYPHKVMYGTPCEYEDGESGSPCSDGYIITGEHKKVCPSCNGSGLKSRTSPVGTMLIAPKTRTNDGDSALTQEPLKFISPSPESLEFVRKEIEIKAQRAKSILHLHTSNSNVKGSENLTATGMVLDSKSMYAFIKPISDRRFTRFEFILKHIGMQRYGERFKMPSLHFPKVFDFKTPEDYLQEISDAITNNLPPSFVQYVLMKYIDSIYGDNERTIKVFNAIVAADRLFGVSQDEINMKLSKSTVGKWEDILHTSAVTFIGEIIESDKNFLEKPLDQQVKALHEKAKAKEKELTPTTAQSIYESTAAA